MRTDEQFVSLVCVADVFSNSIITGGAQSTKGLKTTNNSVMFEQLRGKGKNSSLLHHKFT